MEKQLQIQLILKRTRTGRTARTGSCFCWHRLDDNNIDEKEEEGEREDEKEKEEEDEDEDRGPQD